MEQATPPDKEVQLLMLHATYGKALLTSHQVERRLALLVQCHAISHGYSVPLEAIKKMTLGMLAAEFIKKYDPSDSLVEELDAMVFFRNELAHRISDMIVCRAATKDWHDKIVRQLIDIDIDFRNTNRLLTPYIENCYHVLGVTEQQLGDIARRVFPGLEEAIDKYFVAEQTGASS